MRTGSLAPNCNVAVTRGDRVMRASSLLRWQLVGIINNTISGTERRRLNSLEARSGHFPHWPTDAGNLAPNPVSVSSENEVDRKLVVQQPRNPNR